MGWGGFISDEIDSREIKEIKCREKLKNIKNNKAHRLCSWG